MQYARAFVGVLFLATIESSRAEDHAGGSVESRFMFKHTLCRLAFVADEMLVNTRLDTAITRRAKRNAITKRWHAPNSRTPQNIFEKCHAQRNVFKQIHAR